MTWVYVPSSFSRGLAEDASHLNTCSASEPSVMSSESRTRNKYSKLGSVMVSFMTRPSGTTCARFQPISSEERSTWCVAAFPANPSASQDVAEQQTTIETAGQKPSTSFAHFDRASRFWKTSQVSLLALMGTSERFSETWPKHGSMRAGVCFLLPTLARPMSEGDSGSLLPTPTASRYGSGQNGKRADGTTFKQAGKPSLETMARTGCWRWPTAGDAKQSGSAAYSTASGRHSGTTLTDAIVRSRWRTPTAHNAKEVGAPSEYRRNTPTLAAQAGGKLNPQWVEWLMGWPIGHTDLEPLETDRFRSWLQQHGIFSPRDGND